MPGMSEKPPLETGDEAVSEQINFTVTKGLACKGCGGREFTCACKEPSLFDEGSEPILCVACGRSIGLATMDWREI